MGQRQTIDSEIAQINEITSYLPSRSALFQRANGLSLEFKAVHERSKLFTYLRGEQVMIKVKVVFASQGEKGDAKNNKWYLTEVEFAKVSRLIYEADGQTKPSASAEVPESRICPICQDCPIEQRFPGCNVRSKPSTGFA